jgi:hypothetical protein
MNDSRVSVGFRGQPDAPPASEPAQFVRRAQGSARARAAPGTRNELDPVHQGRMDASLVVNVQPLSNTLGMLQTLSQIAPSVAGMLSLLAAGLAAIGNLMSVLRSE